MNDTGVQLGEETEIADCLEKECAWWDKEKAMCYRASEVRELRFIKSFLRDIRDKMPHKEQD